MDLCLGTAVSVCYLTYEGLCVCGMCVSVCVCVSVSSLCVCVVGSSVSAWPFSAPGKVAPADPRPGQPLRTWPCSPGSAQAQVLRPHPWRPACPKGPFLSLHKAEPQLIPTSMEMPFLGFPTLCPRPKTCHSSEGRGWAHPTHSSSPSPLCPLKDPSHSSHPRPGPAPTLLQGSCLPAVHPWGNARPPGNLPADPGAQSCCPCPQPR